MGLKFSGCRLDATPSGPYYGDHIAVPSNASHTLRHSSPTNQASYPLPWGCERPWKVELPHQGLPVE